MVSGEDEHMVDPSRFAASPQCELVPGMHALAGGLLYIQATSSIVAADVHFGYEEVIGGALPLWSIAESVRHLVDAVKRTQAAEVVLLGDIVHGAHMSEGAGRCIAEALHEMRSHTRLTLIAGNHEGRSRAKSVLGETHDEVERGGWRLVHGDVVVKKGRVIIGHLHPSLHLGGRRTAPAFLSAPSLIVAPAMTPYSPGLNVLSTDATLALRPWMRRGEELVVTGVAGTHVYPFGALEALRGMLKPSGPKRTPFGRSRRLRPT